MVRVVSLQDDKENLTEPFQSVLRGLWIEQALKAAVLPEHLQMFMYLRSHPTFLLSFCFKITGTSHSLEAKIPKTFI